MHLLLMSICLAGPVDKPVTDYPIIQKLYEEAKKHNPDIGDLDKDSCYRCQQWASKLARKNKGLLHAPRKLIRPDKGENIASNGSCDVTATIRQWLQSPGHRKFLLSKHKKCGFGQCTSKTGTCYWVFRAQ